MYFTYILLSLKDGKYYIGCTNNIEKRFALHNNGLVPSTKYRVPLQLVGYETYLTLSEARKREIKIKKMKGGIQFKMLLNIMRV